jgi:predicted alpha/beta hydrolase family esterase
MKQMKYDLCLVLHGCPPSIDNVTPKEKRWMNWLAAELNKRGYNAAAPDMPVSWEPKYLAWKQEIEKYEVSENTLLIGHSCGAAFLVLSGAGEIPGRGE